MDGWLIALIVIALIAFAVITIVYGIRAHQRKISAGVEELIGRKAEVKVALTPKGVVFIDDERWTGISESGNVEAGEDVIVTRVEGMVLYVKKI